MLSDKREKSGAAHKSPAIRQCQLNLNTDITIWKLMEALMRLRRHCYHRPFCFVCFVISYFTLALPTQTSGIWNCQFGRKLTKALRGSNTKWVDVI